MQIYFHCGTLSDYSALVALNTVANRYGALEKKVVVCNLQPLDWHTVQKATDFSEALSFEQATMSAPTGNCRRTRSHEVASRAPTCSHATRATTRSHATTRSPNLNQSINPNGSR